MADIYGADYEDEIEDEVELEDEIEQEDELDDIEDGIDDDAIARDLPQEMTQSYGTGFHDQPQFSVGGGFGVSGKTIRDRIQSFNEASPTLTGGDVDANYEQADAVGDEAVGGTAPTPDQDVVDELGAAVGLEMDDQAFLRTSEILEERDNRRWELEPTSSEDYGDRQD